MRYPFSSFPRLALALLVLGSSLLKADHVLFVGTSVSTIPGTDRVTGVWGEELVLPLEALEAAGHEVTLASPRGQLPIDPASYDPETVGRDLARRVLAFLHLRGSEVASTARLQDLDPEDFDAVFVAGGHGVMWDLAEDPDLRRMAVQALRSGKPLATVCHGPAFLATAVDDQGQDLIAGYQVTGFSDAEEQAIQMDGIVPFSLEQGLRQRSGDRYLAGPAFEPHVVVDRNLITGQNPASSAQAASKLVTMLEGQAKLQAQAQPLVQAHPRAVCDHCHGTGWLQGGPGYYRYRCPTCGGTGTRPAHPGEQPPSTDH